MVTDLDGNGAVDQLRSFTLNDLVKAADQQGQEAVVEFLEDALSVAGSFLAAHGKEIKEYPTVRYDQFDSGVTYDPFHDQGEVLICGGPRGNLRGGEEVLVAQTDFTQRSLLTILSKALLHAYHTQLAEEGDQRSAAEADATRDTAAIRLYDPIGLPVPAIEYGFTTLFDVYLEADITDRSLREMVIEEWTTWYEQTTDIDALSYKAVASTVSGRIETADGSPKEQICHGFAIQEPLIRDGNVNLIAGQ